MGEIIANETTDKGVIFKIYKQLMELNTRKTNNTVKGFNIFNEAEVDVFLEFPCFFYDPHSLLEKYKSKLQ